MKKKKKLRLKRPFQLILAALLFLLAFSFFQLIKNQFKQENKLVSTQVLNYEDLMLKYARENDIEEYLGLLQAMMMQDLEDKEMIQCNHLNVNLIHSLKRNLMLLVIPNILFK